MKTGCYFARGVHIFNYIETDSSYKIQIVYRGDTYWLVGEKKDLLENLHKIVRSIGFSTSNQKRVAVPKNMKIVDKKVARCSCYKGGRAHELTFTNGVRGTICFFCGSQNFVEKVKELPEITLDDIREKSEEKWENALEIIKNETTASRRRILNYIEQRLYRYSGEFFNCTFTWSDEPFGISDSQWMRWNDRITSNVYIPYIFNV